MLHLSNWHQRYSKVGHLEIILSCPWSITICIHFLYINSFPQESHFRLLHLCFPFRWVNTFREQLSPRSLQSPMGERIAQRDRSPVANHFFRTSLVSNPLGIKFPEVVAHDPGIISSKCQTERTKGLCSIDNRRQKYRETRLK